MTATWLDVALGDVADLQFGFPFRSANFLTSPVGSRLLRGDNIGQGKLRWASAKYWPDSDQTPGEYELSAGDVVLAMDRPWIEAGLKYAVVRDQDLPALLVQRVARIRPRSGVAERFLQYVLGDRAFTNYVLGVQTGTAVPHISGGQIRAYRFALPPLDDQRRIAEVLGALDDLIDTNERLANYQNELARSHGQRLLSLVPEGEVGTVDDVASIVKGYSYKSAELVEGTGWLVGLKNVGRGGEFRADGFKPLNAVSKPSQIVENGDLVVAHTDLTQAREIVGRPVRVRRGKRIGTLVASLDLAVVRPKPGVSVEYLQAVLESPAFREHALGYCNGTTVLHMNSHAVPSFPVAVPSSEYMQAFDELAALRAGADDAYDAADELRRTRDELLPLLMSGAVQVQPKEVAA